VRNTPKALIATSGNSYIEFFPVRRSENWLHTCLSRLTIAVSLSFSYIMRQISTPCPKSPEVGITILILRIAAKMHDGYTELKYNDDHDTGNLQI